VEAKNNDGLESYFPSRCHALVQEKPGGPPFNADSFAWMATVSILLFIGGVFFGFI
jgi:hypothetical protein